MADRRRFVNRLNRPKYPHSHGRVRVFWDTENCRLPSGYDARLARGAIERSLRNHGYQGRITITGVVANPGRLSLTTRNRLYRNGIRMTYMRSNRKQVSDVELIRQMRIWDANTPDSETVMLVSGDGGFCHILRFLQVKHNVLVANIEGSRSTKLHRIGSTRFEWSFLL